MTDDQKIYQREYYLKNKERKLNNPSQTPEYKKEHLKKVIKNNPNYNKEKYLKFKEGKTVDELRKQWNIENNKKYSKRKEFISKIKNSNPCYKCGEKRYYVLDFHHVNNLEKIFNIGDMYQHSLKSLKKEIEKCITLCRNCHSEFHYLERDNELNINDYLENNNIKKIVLIDD